MKKGDRVALIRNWDSRGTFLIERAIVHSTGKKIVHLQHLDGTLFKNRFYWDYLNIVPYGMHLIPDADDKVLEQKAIEIAEAYLAREKESIAWKIDQNKKGEYSKGYEMAMNDSLAKLHDPIAKFER